MMKQPDFNIPILERTIDPGGYKSVPIDFNNTLSRDPLVQITEFGIAAESFYARTDGQNWPYQIRITGSLPDVWCRRVVTEKLRRVNTQLRQFGVELFVLDGYRPIETQKGLWAFFEEQLIKEMPGTTIEQRRMFILKYVSDPMRFTQNDPTTWPVHTSGAAIDLTLRSLDTGELLDMGALFDTMQGISHSDALERAVRDGHLSENDPALINRRVLHWGMRREGFVNYPLEFWHFDWGNQMYVYHLSLLKQEAPQAAWYGYVDPPKYT